MTEGESGQFIRPSLVGRGLIGGTGGDVSNAVLLLFRYDEVHKDDCH